MSTENGKAGAQGDPQPETAQSLLSDIADSASEGLHQGKEDAERAAEKAIPAIKRGLDKTAYSASYYLAFGVIYTGRLAAELLPEHGALRQGAADGARAANEVFEQRKQAAAAAAAAAAVAADETSHPDASADAGLTPAPA